MPEPQQQSSGFLGTLKSKFGPLPVWGWLAIVTVVLLGYWLYEQHKQGSQQQQPQATPSSAPGVVVINQGDTNLPAPPAPAPPPPPKGPPKPPEDHDKDDTGKHRGHDHDDHHRHRRHKSSMTTAPSVTQPQTGFPPGAAPEPYIPVGGIPATVQGQANGST